MLEEFLKMLSQDLESVEIEIKENGQIAEISLEPNLVIQVQTEEVGLKMVTSLCSVIEEKKEETYAYLLEANLSSLETGEAVLGLDASKKHYVLTYFLFSGASYKDFYEALESLANFAESWKEEIQGLGS